MDTNLSIPYLRVFLSSPGDVADERAIAAKIVDQLSYDPLLRGKFYFELVAWDKPNAGTPMLANMTPQEAINNGLPKPSECDIVVVIFWARMGTPLPYPTYKKSNDERYFSGTEWEYEDAIQGLRNGRCRKILVYRRTQDPIYSLKDADRQERIEQWELVEKFFEKFEDKDSGALLGGYNAYEKPEDFRQNFEYDLKALVNGLIQNSVSLPASSSDILAPEIWSGSPFPGLRSFTHKDAPIFFGRGREVDTLLERLRHTRFLAVVGASGSGKSSVVWAGLWPRLADNAISDDRTGSKDWIMLRFTPGGTDSDPFMALAVKLEPILEQQGWNARKIAETLANDANGLDEICALALKNHNKWAEVFLFIDQFEELLTIVPERFRLPFSMMLQVSSNSNKIRIVATLRADFYPQCITLLPLTKLLQTGSFPLAAPDPISLYEMITRPAERAALFFEDDLPRQILKDTGYESSALALMAYTLDELYQASDTTDGHLTYAIYESLGRVQGAIGKRAENEFELLSEAVQARLPHVFRELVEVDERGTATRHRSELSRVAIDESALQLVEALTSARLLVQNEEKGTNIVEVAHEALLDSWPRLDHWIEETKDDLRLLRQVRLAAEEWNNKKRSPPYLWPDERLKLVYKMIDALDLKIERDLEDYEREFIRPEYERIQGVLESNISHYDRGALGERLAAINDPRPGVGLRSDGLPDIVWCDVPEGEVLLEDGLGLVKVKSYRISKYLITKRQFKAFIDAEDGYKEDKWWDGLAERDERPAIQDFHLHNHPATAINWYEAVAFCRWLSSKFNLNIRLPTEAEWQQAATGGKPDMVYPWGSKWDPGLANTAENGLRRSTSVGMYPQGASPIGALDMSGNVRDMTLTEFETGRHDDLNSSNRRSKRGSTWTDDRYKARTASRFGYEIGRYSDLGFRVSLHNLDEPTSSGVQLPKEDELNHLMQLLELLDTSHYQRLAIGARLAKLGDPRRGTGLREDGLPDIVWCEVPKGKTLVEEGIGVITVEPFYIAKFLVTKVQFGSFIEAEDGYSNDIWWKGLAHRDEEPSEQDIRLSNYPAVGINWYEAIAFCRWLSVRMDTEIRLPMEAEWQQAATGGKPGMIYPWGSNWDSRLTNTDESGLEQPIAVGMYPQGASPIGVLDMSGNVRDMTLTEYETGKHNDLSNSNKRSKRGGTWSDAKERARTTARFGYKIGRYTDLGFRVCCKRLPILEVA